MAVLSSLTGVRWTKGVTRQGTQHFRLSHGLFVSEACLPICGSQLGDVSSKATSLKEDMQTQSICVGLIFVTRGREKGRGLRTVQQTSDTGDISRRRTPPHGRPRRAQNLCPSADPH